MKTLYCSLLVSVNIRKWVGVAIGFATLIFYHLFKIERLKNEKLESDIKSADHQIQSKENAGEIVKNVKRKNAIDDRPTIERLRDKKYLRD